MKRLFGIVVALVATLGLAACATDVSTTADGSNSKGSSAKVGQPITIKGNDKGSKIRVLVKRVTPTKSTEQYFTADKGKRLVAVQFVITNTGTIAYSDAPSNGAKVVDGSGQQFDADATFTDITAGAALPTEVKLAPGNRALGYLVFQVPMKSKVAQVQFSEDSGFGGTAQWNVKR